MSDILFLALDDPAGTPADDYPTVAGLALPWADAPGDGHADARADDPDGVVAARAARQTRAGCAAARSGDWAAAADLLAAGARSRAALVADGRAAPAVAVRGWSDAAVLAAARDDASGAADALARARALDADDVPAEVHAALDDVTAWLRVLGGAAAPVDVARAPAARADTPAVDLAADLATALLVEPIAPTCFPFEAAAAAEPELQAVPGYAAPVGALDAADGTPEPSDALVFLPVDDGPATAAPTVVATHSAAPEPAASPAPTGLAYLDLEGPVRPWERAAAVVVAEPGPAPPHAPLAAPLARPLAGPLAPALRNAKIDEAVALATAPSSQAPGRLRSLFGRLRGK